MSEQLGISIPQVESALGTVSDEGAQVVLSSGDYLPYISVMGSNTNFVKEGKISMGVIAVIKNQLPVDLGKEIAVVVIAERFKAMRFGENILSYFDYKSDEFKKIQAESGEKDAQCAAGLEFLIWIPSHGEGGTFAGLFCGTKSLKKEARNIRKFVGGKAMTLKTVLLSNARFKWHSAQCLPCTTPIGALPDPDELLKQLTKFKNPKASTVEKAEPSAGGRAR